MIDRDHVIDAIVRVAGRWQDPEHPQRQSAVEATLGAPNRFTGEAVTYALNQQMSLLTREALERWIGNRQAENTRAVGVIGAGNVPAADLQDFLAVLLVGHRYVGAPSSKSPYLVRAFAEELGTEAELPVSFAGHQSLPDSVDVLIATGSDETIAEVRDAAVAAGISEGDLLLRGNRYGVAVLDGRETEDELEGLAEDAFLHEGLGCRNVALVWAPAGTPVDPYLEACRHFRSVFPSHPATPGTLRMQQAFLAAVKKPHAYAEDLSFLISRGEAEVKGPAHLRWVEYAGMPEVLAWLNEHRDEIQVLVRRKYLAATLGEAGIPAVEPGQSQRPPLDWQPDGRDTVGFLTRPGG
jgi:acyl-CoA reductase-like NAD-dependent aldehyde dehydrogenase